ncbi:MAG TPA: histidine phosphatase family protein [Actinomycetota bacterium]|jgi:broad specificity phosphatase PhoE|nr:histidine phosphatase family protein [Actinomycetota bacterium]
MRSLELRRHSHRDPDSDRLSEEGEGLALQVGKDLPGGYAIVFTSPTRRAAETAAWFLRGLGQKLPPHGVEEGLTSPVEDRWRSAAKIAATGRLDEVEKVDADLVEKESSRLADAIRHLLGEVPEGGRGLAVGHTPLIEAAVYGLTGRVIEPLGECEGVLVEQEGDEVQLAAEYRLER